MSKVPDLPADIHSYYESFSTQATTVSWLQNLNVLQKPYICEQCNMERKLEKNGKHGLRWTCKCKKNRFSLFKNTFFSNLRVPLHLIMRLALYFWVNMTQTQAMLLAGIDKETASTYYARFRLANENYLLQHPITLGGGIKTVEIDEAAVFRRKYKKGRPKMLQWLFGMVERPLYGKGRTNCLIVPVARRDKATLLPIIQANLPEGTRVNSDGWRSYACLRKHHYIHSVVNHKQNFRDPETGTHTNRIEGLWSIMRKHFPRTGVKRHLLPSYLADFQYRRSQAASFPHFIQHLSLARERDD